MRFTRRSKRAVVLGCGPSGMFAAHALIQRDWDVQIFSNRSKSTMYGAQYLHAPIPGLTYDDRNPDRIEYRLTGDAEEYRAKVYGGAVVQVSPEALEESHDAWDIRAAYDTAWDLYGHQVNHLNLTPESIAHLSADVVVSSIPLPRTCMDPDTHKFEGTGIWALGDAPDRGQTVPYRPEYNVVECNGTRDVGWYRAANVMGHCTVEWPERNKPPLPGVAYVTKPTFTNCTCHFNSDRFKMVRVGRYGTWSKGVLSHSAYDTAARL